MASMTALHWKRPYRCRHGKGTEIAKEAADLILIDDDLSKMIIAVAAGRRIYSNLKKAIRYIVSIHIPIILAVSLPLF
jgi:Ca2+-transporting ATPase